MADLLVLGGTGFVGAAVVAAASRLGHEVTILTRGRTGHLPPGVRGLTADRDDPDSMADAVAGRAFDAVIDVNGLAARRVRTATRLLADHTDHYALVSSISVYDEDALGGTGPVGEHASTTPADPDDPGLPDMARYSAQKRGAELALADVIGPDRTLIARPTFVLGPRENVHRMAYWLSRGAAGRDVLGPGSPAYPLQLVDVDDLAEWLVTGAVSGQTGTHNVANPPGRDTWLDWVEAVMGVAGSKAVVDWVPDEFLLARGVTANVGIPMWIPGGMPLFDVSRAAAAGFHGRPIGETVQAAWDWWNALPVERRGAGQAYRPAPITPEVEATILAAHRAR